MSGSVVDVARSFVKRLSPRHAEREASSRAEAERAEAQRALRRNRRALARTLHEGAAAVGAALATLATQFAAARPSAVDAAAYVYDEAPTNGDAATADERALLAWHDRLYMLVSSLYTACAGAAPSALSVGRSKHLHDIFAFMYEMHTGLELYGAGAGSRGSLSAHFAADAQSAAAPVTHSLALALAAQTDRARPPLERSPRAFDVRSFVPRDAEDGPAWSDDDSDDTRSDDDDDDASSDDSVPSERVHAMSWQRSVPALDMAAARRGAPVAPAAAAAPARVYVDEQDLEDDDDEAALPSACALDAAARAERTPELALQDALRAALHAAESLAPGVQEEYAFFLRFARLSVRVATQRISGSSKTARRLVLSQLVTALHTFSPDDTRALRAFYARHARLRERRALRRAESSPVRRPRNALRATPSA